MRKTKNLSNFRVWLLLSIAAITPVVTCSTAFAQRGGRRGSGGNGEEMQSEGRRSRDFQGGGETSLRQSQLSPVQPVQGLRGAQGLQAAPGLQGAQGFQQSQQGFNPGVAQPFSGGVRGTGALTNPGNMISGSRVQRSIVVNNQRVTMDLPAAFAAGDLNKDGQIALIEWKQWQSGQLQQFTTYDTNNDGYLTPVELVNAPAPQGSGLVGNGAQSLAQQPGGALNSPNGVGAGGMGAGAVGNNPNGSRQFTPNTRGNTLSSGNGRGRGGPNGESSGIGGGRRGRGGRTEDSGNSGGAAGIAPAADNLASSAASRFRLIDADSNGTITPEEFGVSAALKAQFSKAGIDVSQPLSEADFVKNFLTVNAAPAS